MRFTRVLPLVVVAVLLLAVGLVVQLAPGVASRTGIVARSDRFVSLALDDPRRPIVAAGDGAVRFSFTITSTYATPVRQAWVVTLGPQGEAGVPYASGVVTVPADGRLSVPVGFTIPKGSGVREARVGAPGRGLAPLQFPVQPHAGGAS